MTVKLYQEFSVHKLKYYTKNICSVKTLRKRLPIVQWLPKYNKNTLFRDLIAGITVGLTAIPQGLAYAVVAGLPPEYGLYAGLMGGFVYLFLGSCKDITVGPTAIMSAMVAKYVSGYSADFAVLAAFLAGVIELTMGILHLGFLVEFISQPVIFGFTTAAALQIASSQLKSLFGLTGSSGNYFAESMYNFIQNIHTIQLWDPIFGVFTIIVLILLKRLGHGGTNGVLKQVTLFLSLGKNAVVVIIGIVVAYSFKAIFQTEPLSLIGDIGSGLPTFKLPPFSTVIGNTTYSFKDMAQVLGFQSIALPLVAILESVAIAKAFAKNVPVDATQEMIALGLCNIIGSFASSMPITGSFTRTALNNASGVQTPAGGVFTGLLIILALSLLTSTFFFIPKATLAGLIIFAMFSMIDYTIFSKLWKSSKRELLVITVTIAVCLFFGIEFGIITGIVIEAVMLLYISARPKVDVGSSGSEQDIIIIQLSDNISYCAAEHVRKIILKAAENENDDKNIISTLVIDGTNLRRLDSTAASNLISAFKDLEKMSIKCWFLNFSSNVKNICIAINPEIEGNFLTASCAEVLVNVLPKET